MLVASRLQLIMSMINRREVGKTCTGTRYHFPLGHKYPARMDLAAPRVCGKPILYDSDQRIDADNL